jgi:hypothetical protein
MSAVTIGVGVALQAREEKPAALASLIESERAFAKMAVEKGTREAFLAFLADESLLFAPGPVPGKLFYRNRPTLPQVLSWAPDFADVAASGDLGYTSGPWEIRKSAITDPPSAFGHFNSIWRVQKDGTWKVEVDLGATHEKPAIAVADVKTVDTPKDNAPPPKESETTAAKTNETKTKEELQNELLEVDRALAKRAAEEGVGVLKAFEGASADSLRVYRDGNLPAVGKSAALKLLASSGTGAWNPTLARVSKAGDLGYTTGVIKIESAKAPPTPPPAPKPPTTGGSTGSTSSSAPAPAPPTAPAPPAAGAPNPQNRPSLGATPPAPSAPHYYVRIWRRDKAGVWKIVLDVATA